MVKLEINILYNGPQNRRYATGFESAVWHASFVTLFGGDIAAWSDNGGEAAFKYNLLDITSRTNRNLIESKFEKPYNYSFCQAQIIGSLVDQSTGAHSILFRQSSCGNLINFNASFGFPPDNPRVLYPNIHNNLVQKISGAVQLVANQGNDNTAEASFGIVPIAILILIALGLRQNATA